MSPAGEINKKKTLEKNQTFFTNCFTDFLGGESMSRNGIKIKLDTGDQGV